MIRFVSIAFVLSIIILNGIQHSTGDNTVSCGENEVPVECVEACQPTCAWRKRPQCPSFRCEPGCHCKYGYYRATDELGSPCVNCADLPKCGRRERLSFCGNPCQPSCSWKDRPPCPTFTCLFGCYCQENFYRATNNSNSPCIKC